MLIGILVRDHGVEFPLTQARLVDRQAWPHVLRKQHILRCMTPLVPVTVIADMILVGLAQQIAVSAVISAYRADARSVRLYALLLKKPRTPS